ncbi:ABC-type phosphate transport system substrate-binding protein [Crossiella equi]|uniref:ABC-type phosphate transport system substrate-binding protein n=1 Tax=Crossiella equi TaxID=130796 RepID=A0ABS5AGJ8_9PSEU|nr:hypothetical protein [Crossiella equi]MBP2475706.1 ABC-type phosphate transport system substrate-binding protein [Crossiella equi]
MQTRTALATLALASGLALLAGPAASAQPGTNTYTVDFEAGKTTFGDGSTFRLPARVMIATDCAPEKAGKVKVTGLGEFTLHGGSAGVAMGEFTLGKQVKAGRYAISFACGAVEHKGTFSVVGAPTSKPRPTTTSAAVPTKPKGAPETGGGATAEDADRTPLLAGGAAVLLGALLGVVALRRRRVQD